MIARLVSPNDRQVSTPYSPFRRYPDRRDRVGQRRHPNRHAGGSSSERRLRTASFGVLGHSRRPDQPRGSPTLLPSTPDGRRRQQTERDVAHHPRGVRYDARSPAGGRHRRLRAAVRVCELRQLFFLVIYYVLITVLSFLSPI